MLTKENLIATFEQSLQQTRNAQNRLLGRLYEIETESAILQNENEVERLRNEIEALGKSAEKTEEAFYSIIAMQE